MRERMENPPCREELDLLAPLIARSLIRSSSSGSS
jgi:hypothetical protein